MATYPNKVGRVLSDEKGMNKVDAYDILLGDYPYVGLKCYTYRDLSLDETNEVCAT